MASPLIFISYRRDDAAGYARAVYDGLARHFGADRVFMDVDDIDTGLPFADVIARAVGESKVLLVLIGTRWLGEREGEIRRIDAPGDFVAGEVALALAKSMRVIPVLLDGTAMPTEAQLPDRLKPLAARNALELGNTRFAADVDHLVATLREALPSTGGVGLLTPASTPASVPARSRLPIAATAAVCVLAVAAMVGAWQWLARSDTPVVSATRAPASVATARPSVDGAWQAQVAYDWPGANYLERFEFAGDGAGLHGSVSFLGVPRGLLEGSVEATELRFATRTREMPSGDDTVHRYRARIVGDELRFVMQTEGGASSHVPVEFVAHRVTPVPALAPAPAAASR